LRTKEKGVARKSVGYRIMIWGLLLASLLLLWRLNGILSHPKYIPIDDFVRHWAAGKLFLSGDDPFSIPKIQVLQDQATGTNSQMEVINTIYITPWSMVLLAPFALLDYPISRLAWLLFSIILLILSAEWLWKTYEGPPHRKWLSWIIVFSFSPTISVLEKGQTGCLVLLGVAGFLYFEKLQKHFLAGAIAAFISVKPQLIFLFWPALLFWSIHWKNWKALLSCGITILIASAASFAINPGIFQHYLVNVRFHSPLMWATPTIGGYLRYFIFGVEQFWPQYIGPVIGLALFVVYWVKEAHAWTWKKNTPDLVLGSAVTSFYSWTYDQVVVLPAVVKAWIHMLTRGKSARLIIGLFFFIQLVNLIMHRYLDDFWFIWFAPAMLLWYCAVEHTQVSKSSSES
jgi:hypothetical protein